MKTFGLNRRTFLFPEQKCALITHKCVSTKSRAASRYICKQDKYCKRHFFSHIKKSWQYGQIWQELNYQLKTGPAYEEGGKRHQRIVKIKRGESFQTFVLTFGIINQTSKLQISKGRSVEKLIRELQYNFEQVF